MKKLLVAGMAAMAMVGFEASADITVKLPANSGMDSISYYHAPIQKLASAKSSAERGIVEGKAPVINGVAKIAIDPAEGASRASVVFSQSDYIDIYAEPNDPVVATVSSLSPFEYKLSGSALIDGMNEVNSLFNPLIAKQKAMEASGETNREELMASYNECIRAVKDYIEENLTSPNAVYAVMQLKDNDFIDAFDRLSERAKSSIIYPLAEVQYKGIKKSLEIEKKQQEMANGNTPAPEFTLKNLEGKDVSLSEFKGKWVVLDFWGSWCIWCIKGFPELKEAYAKYKGQLEIIGIDCNETEEAWKAGVAKHELPWVNVYCPKGNPLFEQYGIQGFPTKAIIDPEGKIKNITTGHDPEFFNILNSLIAK